MTIAVMSFLLCAMFTPSCVGGFDCVDGRGETISESRSATPFSAIRINGSAHVILSQNRDLSVTVEGQKNILELVTTEVNSGELVIDTRGCIRSGKPVRVVINAPNIEALTIDGSGNISGATPINAEELSLRIDGSGDIELEVDTQKLQTVINGSGDIALRGSAQQHSIKIAGSGDIRAFDLSTEDSDIKIYGSGDCEANVAGSLDATIRGSGDIVYIGSPHHVERSIDGSGDIEQR